MRKLLLFAVALLIAFPAIMPVAAQAKTELRVVWWGSQSRHDRTIKVINMYMAAHPDINITYEYANFNDYWVKLNTQAAGGELPCVMQQDYAYVAEWANRGLIKPLDDYYKNKMIDTKNIAQGLLDGGKVGDHYYALSLGSNSQSIIVDTDAFKKAGLDLPSKQWTWKDFEDISTKLHDKLGIWATANGLEDVQMWKSVYLAYGMSVFNKEGTGLGYTDDKPLIDYFNMLLRLQKSGAMIARDEAIQYANGSMENEPIVTGKEVFRYQWSNQVVAIFKAAGKDRNLHLWPLPRPEGQKSANYLKPSQFFSITTQCKTPDEGAKFIDYVTNSLEANDVLLAERGVPVSSAVREHLLPNLDAVGKETFQFLADIEKDSSPIYPPDPPGYSDMVTNVYTPQFVDPVLYGQTSVEDGVAALRKGAEAILAKNKK